MLTTEINSKQSAQTTYIIGKSLIKQGENQAIALDMSCSLNYQNSKITNCTIYYNILDTTLYVNNIDSCKKDLSDFIDYIDELVSTNVNSISESEISE